MFKECLSQESLSQFEALVEDAIEKGQSLDWIVRQIRDRGEHLGWHEAFEYRVPKRRHHRVCIIYVACSQIHYAAFRQKQIAEAGYGTIVYRCGDGCPDAGRHCALNGMALPNDHPFWALWSPPNGMRCSCYIAGARNEENAVRLGGDPNKPLPEWWDDPVFGPDPDFRGFNRPSFERIVERALQD